MNQLTMNLETRSLARGTDPQSSHQAAERIVREGVKRDHESRILEALRRATHALNCKEIAFYADFEHAHVVLKRMAALERKGLIRRDGYRDKMTAWRVAE